MKLFGTLPETLFQPLAGPKKHVYAPAKTPGPVVEKLSEASRKALAEPEFEKALTDSGFETAFYSGDSARKYMADELARWKPVIDAIGLKTL